MAFDNLDSIFDFDFDFVFIPTTLVYKANFDFNEEYVNLFH